MFPHKPWSVIHRRSIPPRVSGLTLLHHWKQPVFNYPGALATSRTTPTSARVRTSGFTAVIRSDCQWCKCEALHTADCFDNSQAWADRGPTVEVHCCVSPAHSRTKRNHSSPSSSSVSPMVRRGLLLRCRARRDPHRRPPASVFSADTP